MSIETKCPKCSEADPERYRLAIGGLGNGIRDPKEGWGGGGGGSIGLAVFDDTDAFEQLALLNFWVDAVDKGLLYNFGVSTAIPFATRGPAKYFGLCGESIHTIMKEGDYSKFNTRIALGVNFFLLSPTKEGSFSGYFMLSPEYSIGVGHESPGGFYLDHGPMFKTNAGFVF